MVISIFSKIAIITNFSLNPVSGEKFHVDSTKGSLLKSRLKFLDMVLKKMYRNTLPVVEVMSSFSDVAFM